MASLYNPGYYNELRRKEKAAEVVRQREYFESLKRAIARGELLVSSLNGREREALGYV